MKMNNTCHNTTNTLTPPPSHFPHGERGLKEFCSEMGWGSRSYERSEDSNIAPYAGSED